MGYDGVCFDQCVKFDHRHSVNLLKSEQNHQLSAICMDRLRLFRIRCWPHNCNTNVSQTHEKDELYVCC